MHTRHPFDIATFKLAYAHPANPAPGEGYVIAMPINCRIEITSVQFTFGTDANVADRLVYVAPSVAAALNQHFNSPRVQVAAATSNYHFFRGAPSEPGFAPVANEITASLGVGCIYDNLTAIAISAANLQAGDQFADIFLWYRIWMQGTFPA